MNNTFLPDLFAIFLKAWPIWLILFAVLLGRLLAERIIPGLFHAWKLRNRFRKGEQWRSGVDRLKWLQSLTPNEFEEYIADLFRRLGFKTKTVGGSYDGGIDVIAEKGGVKHYIQCKKFITSQVSVEAVRDFYGATAGLLAAGKGYFITTNKFTLEAEKFAEDKPIELIDGFRLLEYIAMDNESNEVIESNLPRSCPQCEGELVERKGRYGKFFGCSNYPRCKHTEKINRV